MRKKKFGIILFIFSILIISSVIIKAYQSSSPAQTSPDNPAELAEASDEVIELIAWTDLDGFNEFEQKYIDLYNSMYDNFKIRVVARPGDLDTDMMTAMMSESAPDILILSYDEVTAYSYMGALLPLDDYFNSWNDFKNINQNIADKFKIDGHYYGLPCGEYAMSLLYNKAVFEENHIAVPAHWTWDDFINICKALKNDEKGRYGFALNWNQWGNWWFQMFVWAAGGNLTKMDDNGRLTTTFTDPAVITAAQYYRTLKNEQCIQPDMTLRLDDLKKDFACGNAAMIFSGLDALSDFTDLGMKPDDIGVLPLPTGPGGTNTAQIGGSCYVLHRNVAPEKREAVFKYYELVSSKAYFEDKARYFHSQNIPFLQGQLRTDINYTELLSDISPEIVHMMVSSTENGRPSYYGSPIVSTFIDSALQKTMLDPNSDIEDVFTQYENEANNQAVPQYNDNFQN